MNNIKLLPSGEKKNFKETNLSITYMWKIRTIRSIIIPKMEYIHKMFLVKKENKNRQDNIEIQIIQKNNIIKNIATATKKVGLINPIIPKIKENNEKIL